MWTSKEIGDKGWIYIEPHREHNCSACIVENAIGIQSAEIFVYTRNTITLGLVSYSLFRRRPNSWRPLSRLMSRCSKLHVDKKKLIMDRNLSYMRTTVHVVHTKEYAYMYRENKYSQPKCVCLWIQYNYSTCHRENSMVNGIHLHE